MRPGSRYWVDQLSTGALTTAQVLAAIVESPEAQARDAVPVTNFLVAAGAGTADYAGDLFSPTNAPGTTFTLTTGADNITLTGVNDKVTGVSDTNPGIPIAPSLLQTPLRVLWVVPIL